MTQRALESWDSGFSCRRVPGYFCMLQGIIQWWDGRWQWGRGWGIRTPCNGKEGNGIYCPLHWGEDREMGTKQVHIFIGQWESWWVAPLMASVFHTGNLREEYHWKWSVGWERARNHLKWPKYQPQGKNSGRWAVLSVSEACLHGLRWNLSTGLADFLWQWQMCEGGKLLSPFKVGGLARCVDEWQQQGKEAGRAGGERLWCGSSSGSSLPSDLPLPFSYTIPLPLLKGQQVK